MKKFIFPLFATIVILLVGCKSDTEDSTVQQALNKIKDKNSVKEFVVNGEVKGEDWLILRNLNKQLPNVEAITLNDAVTITTRAFLPDDVNENTWLKSFKAPKVTELHSEALYGCKKLVNVELPETSRLGKFSFGFCESLTSITLNKIKEVSEKCFYNCINLQSFNFPSLERIGSASFMGCNSLKSISLTQIKEVPDDCFSNCTSLEIIDLPQVTEIGKYGFFACRSLKTIEFENLVTLGEGAFADCFALEKATFNNLTNIGKWIFSYSHKLNEMKLLSTDIIKTEEEWWGNGPKDVKLYLHTNNYKNAVGNIWKGVTWSNIVEVN